MPNFLHVIPVSNNAMLSRVLQGQNTALALSLIDYIAVFLVHANHDTRHLRAPNNRWEDSPGCIITCEAGLAHATAVVHDESCNFFLAHGCREIRESERPRCAQKRKPNVLEPKWLRRWR